MFGVESTAQLGIEPSRAEVGEENGGRQDGESEVWRGGIKGR